MNSLLKFSLSFFYRHISSLSSQFSLPRIFTGIQIVGKGGLLAVGEYIYLHKTSQSSNHTCIPNFLIYHIYPVVPRSWPHGQSSRMGYQITPLAEPASVFPASSRSAVPVLPMETFYSSWTMAFNSAGPNRSVCPDRLEISRSHHPSQSKNSISFPIYPVICASWRAFWPNSLCYLLLCFQFEESWLLVVQFVLEAFSE